ncbi:hypothetical protein J1N35_018751 [Gossypium stocksii]|uniref:RNase H type-1 domain-containing protein n=1 Tax=Gossypium stocksii TaxID=47602 RepID=A0A9D4A6G6_9ROSI|nr:hypothetical protein J1N35_018751 [Gossypium stocksii]
MEERLEAPKDCTAAKDVWSQILTGHPWNSREIVNTSFCWASQCFSTSRVATKGGVGSPLEKQSYTSTTFLNTDGAVHSNTGIASAGGVARDMNRQWLFGFNRYLGKCSIFDAELWGIFEGLKILQRRGHDHVIILLDSLDVIRAIQGSNLATSNSALIRRIQSILSQENSWILRYIPREHNEAADCLAKEALSS